MKTPQHLLKSPWQYFALYVVFVIVAALLLFQNYQEREQNVVNAQNHLVEVTHNSLLHGFANNAELIFENIIDKPFFQQRLFEANSADEERRQVIRDEIYNRLFPLYNSMDKFKLKQLHFHLHNNDSFLRFHRPNKFGDNLTDIRGTIAYVNRTGMSIQGFEEGRIFNGYRFVFPLFWNKQQAGSVETSVSMKVLMNAMARDLSGKVSFIIRRDIVESKVFQSEMSNYEVTPFSDDFMYEASLMHLNSRLQFAKILQAWRDQYGLKINDKTGIESHFLEIAGQGYMVSLLPVLNAISREPIGYLVYFQESNEQDLAVLEFIAVFLAVITVAALMLLLLYRSRSNEVALRQSEAIQRISLVRFEKAQQISNLGTWEYDPNTQQLYWSDQVFRIFDERPQSFEPTYDRFLSYVHPDDREQVDYAFRYALSHGTPYQVKHRIYRHDGSMIYVEEECEHQFDDNGMVVRSTGTIHDITNVVEREQRLERLGERYQALVERLPNLVYRFSWEAERRWKMDFANASARFYTGHYAYELLAKEIEFLQIIHPDDLERVQQYIYSTLQADKSYELEYRIQRPDGSVVVVSDSGQKVLDEDGMIQVEGVMTDITAQRQALEKLQKFIDTQKSIVILTDGHLMTFANQAYFNFFGIDRKQNPEVAQRCICDYFEPGEHFFDLSKLRLEDQHWVDAIMRIPPSQRNVAMKNAAGELITFAVEVSQFDERNFVVSFQDISDAFMEKLMWRQKASIDSLTSAYNRHFFELSIHSFIKIASREDKKIGLLMFDVDDFKQINDRYGHGKGDEVLKDLSNLLKRNLRESDLLIRWGGEEFVIVLAVENRQVLDKIAENLRSVIKRDLDSSVGMVTCSFGGTLINDQHDIEQAIKRADAGLYHVKENGKNGYQFVAIHDME
ncbi:diguanylate cyclase [Thiomicrorhabdus sp. 6S2-11]|jgi:diguanylate cyclase (GGDEF)-like protein/PAS domain S-box-containing protein|uniref:Diguanylate cyclase n=1 Tax=Thiomicrorhabdus marina TaxID=2818442 RepID=A0ABS3Q4X7_9GAMM|nr:diguanylate cyclase [Thiomicrorhabdus marina]MBO1927322.1 diguanylate cyclase [Thiomicrorhabdus marina]